VEWYCQRKSEVFGAKSVHGRSSSLERWVKGGRLSDLMTSKKYENPLCAVTQYRKIRSHFRSRTIRTMSVDHLWA
jgi:hypothetical protein